MYWIGEYIKVLIAYFGMIFVWPMIVFYPVLRKKTLSFCFSFCATAQVLLLSSVVLLLGVFNVLNPWLVRVLFYGVFLIQLVRFLLRDTHVFDTIARLYNRTLGVKQLTYTLLRDAGRRVGHYFRMEKGALVRRTLLFLLMIYGMIYFSYGPITNPSYAFSDMNVHHSWTTGLINGIAFSKGIYPEAMHCVAYCLHILFNIDIFSCLLFLSGVQSSALILAIYLFFKSVFHWNYTPIFAVTLFLILDVMSINPVMSMARIQCSLPQEYGLFSEFLIAAYLINYLKTALPQKKLLWTSDLLLFMLSLAVSISIHFYITIMAFFLCLGIVVIMPLRVLNKKRFVPLAAAALCGLILAATPMVIAFARGIPLQGSLNWALGVMGLDITKEDVEPAETDDEGEPEIVVYTKSEEDLERERAIAYLQELPEEDLHALLLSAAAGEASDGSAPLYDEDGNQIGITYMDQNGTERARFLRTVDGMTLASAFFDEEGVLIETEEDTTPKTTSERIRALINRLIQSARNVRDAVYYQGYMALHQQKRADWIIKLSLIAVALDLLWRLIARIFKKLPGGFMNGYAILAAATALMILEYVSPAGFPRVIESYRLCSTVQVLICGLIFMFVDLFFDGLNRVKYVRLAAQPLSLACVACVIAAVILTGHYHGYLLCSLTQYNGASNTLYRIITSMPKESYTVVSPTDELYKVIQYSYHEEIQQLMGMQSQRIDQYFLPTKYVFVFHEKNAMEYAQYHFFTGPKFLALSGRYSAYFGRCSEGDHYIAVEVTDDYADRTIPPHTAQWSQYTDPYYRATWEARLARWIERFQAVYPDSIDVYYEDDDFICYCIRQNPQCTYNMKLL